MKIVYIGKSGALSEAVTERLGQEGHDIYLLSDKDIPRKNTSISLHRFPLKHKGEDLEEILRSISPECIIFAGNHYIGDSTGADSDADQELLSRSLRVASEFKKVKFIVLSSIEVYGPTAVQVKETANCEPVSERGIRFLREEKLLDIYKDTAGMDITILRVSRLYSDHPKEGGKDILSKTFTEALYPQGHLTDHMFQPLNVLDLAWALTFVLGETAHQIYNISSEDEISGKRLYQMVCESDHLEEHEIRWDKPQFITFADSGLFREEFGWKNQHTIENDLKNGRIHFERSKEKPPKKHVIPTNVRKVLENVFLFLVFFGLTLACAQVPILAQFNWLLVYVILIALAYSIYQSALSALLASAAFIFLQLSGLDANSDMSSYADIVLSVMEFIFFGFIVSYTTNTLREKAESAREDQKLVEDDYEDLRFINEENVLIKNEYEDRLLASRSGFPRAYELLRRLTLKNTDDILKEAVPVISELVGTETVAVYRTQPGSDALVLANSSSGKAEVYGNTWRLADSPKVKKAVDTGDFFQGELGTDEPAAVMPIMCNDGLEAVIVIKALPFESENLYNVNLLKTVSLLLQDSLNKALDYEALSRTCAPGQASGVA